MVCYLALYKRFLSSLAIGSRTLPGFLSPLHFPKDKGQLEFYISYFKIIKIDLLLFLNRREKKYLQGTPQPPFFLQGSPQKNKGVWGLPRKVFEFNQSEK
jgi:hypothetical protein